MKSLFILLSLLHCSRAGQLLNLTASCASNAHCSFSGLSSNFNRPVRFTNNSVPLLQELIFRNSVIRQLPCDALELAPNLRAFHMHNAGLFSLSAPLFHYAPRLERLVLQRNPISHLAERQFALLPLLQVLELGHNIIHTVHQQAFVGLTQLSLLGLQGNGIRTLMDGALAPLLNLTHLDLSGNEIEKLNGATFAQNAKLQTLLLGGNRFAAFKPDALAGLPRLRLLDVSNCAAVTELRVHSADTLLAESSGLQRLVIGGSVIRLLAGNNELTQVSIADKRALVELDLHTNLLGSNVTALLEGMLNLQRLDLSRNDIESLDSSNSSASACLLLPSLTHLNLGYNRLHTLLPETLLLLGRLVQLDVSFNHLLLCPAENFEPLVDLERLYIEGNRLHQFDYELFHRQHAHLKELGLCDNEWEFSFMRKMVTYLSDRGVHLPARFVRRQDDANGTLTPKLVDAYQSERAAVVAAQLGVAGIHPYWTTHDILAFLTLVVVLIILLLLLFRILQEEGCWARCLQRWRSRSAAGVANATRPRRLNEEDSEV